MKREFEMHMYVCVKTGFAKLHVGPIFRATQAAFSFRCVSINQEFLENRGKRELEPRVRRMVGERVLPGASAGETHQLVGDGAAITWTLHASSCAYASTYAYASYATANERKHG